MCAWCHYVLWTVPKVCLVCEANEKFLNKSSPAHRHYEVLKDLYSNRYLMPKRGRLLRAREASEAAFAFISGEAALKPQVDQGGNEGPEGKPCD